MKYCIVIYLVILNFFCCEATPIHDGLGFRQAIEASLRQLNKPKADVKKIYCEVHSLIDREVKNMGLNLEKEIDLSVLVDVYKSLAEIKTKQSIITASYVKNIITFKIAHDVVDGKYTGHYADLIKIMDDLKLNYNQLSVFYGDKELEIQHPELLEDYFINIINSNSGQGGIILNKNNVRMNAPSIMFYNLKPFCDSLKLDDEYAGMSRVFLIEKIFNINLKVLVESCRKNIVNYDDYKDENSSRRKSDMKKVLVENKDFEFMGVSKGSLHDAHALLYNGPEKISIFRPIIL